MRWLQAYNTAEALLGLEATVGELHSNAEKEQANTKDT